MSKVLIGSNGEALTLIRDASERIVDAVTAELRSGTLCASRQVVHSYATGFTDLVAFFESLAHDWRGWDGERRWDSLEGDLASSDAPVPACAASGHAARAWTRMGNHVAGRRRSR